MACTAIPDLTVRCEKGTPLTPLEIDKNFSNIIDSFTEICSIIDVLDGSTGGGLTGLDVRVTQNENDIAQNVLDIATNALDVATNVAAIGVNAGGIATNVADISSNLGLINANIVDIAALTASIGTFAGDIATNAADIATNVADIATNAAAIASQGGQITSLTGQQATNTGDIATNAVDIGQNTSDIAANAGDIATNAADIATNVADIVATNAEIDLIGKFQSTSPVLITQQLVGTNPLFPAGDIFNLNTIAAVPLLAPAVLLEIRIECVSTVADDNEAYTDVNASGKLGRCVTGVGIENIATNDRQFWVDTRGGLLANFDLTVIQEVLIAGTAHALIPASKTELWVIGYRLP